MCMTSKTPLCREACFGTRYEIAFEPLKTTHLSEAIVTSTPTSDQDESLVHHFPLPIRTLDCFTADMGYCEMCCILYYCPSPYNSLSGKRPGIVANSSRVCPNLRRSISLLRAPSVAPISRCWIPSCTKILMASALRLVILITLYSFVCLMTAPTADSSAITLINLKV